jgi:hypothetical protein
MSACDIRGRRGASGPDAPTIRVATLACSPDTSVPHAMQNFAPAESDAPH